MSSNTINKNIKKNLTQLVDGEIHRYSADEKRNKKKPLFYPTKETRKKLREERAKNRAKSPEYQKQCLLYMLYLIYMSKGKDNIYPSQTTLGKAIGVNRDTCRKRLRNLIDSGWLSKWTFRLYQTNLYHLCSLAPVGRFRYLFNKVKRPIGFKVPNWLWGMVMANLRQAWAYSLLKYNLTHESFLKEGKKYLKYIKDREKNRKKLQKSKFGVPCPVREHLLITKYGLKQSQATFLARNDERVLYLAMEDVDTYSKSVKSYFGLLINRCRYHGSRKRNPEKKSAIRNKLEWVKDKLLKCKLTVFIQEPFQEEGKSKSKTYVRLREHKEEPNMRSTLDFYFYNEGTPGIWQDYRITLGHERFEELVKPFLV